jgi:hypothetical protein
MLKAPETLGTAGLMTVLQQTGMGETTRRGLSILPHIRERMNDTQNAWERILIAESDPVVKNVNQDQGIRHKIDQIDVIHQHRARMEHLGNQKDLDVVELKLIHIATGWSAKSSSRNGPCRRMLWLLPEALMLAVQKLRISILKGQL